MDKPKQTPPEVKPGAFSISEFAEAFKIGRSTVYDLLDAGKIRSFYVGRRRLISFTAAQEWQRKCETAEQPI